MSIENNKVVSFHYRLSEPTAGVIEDSHGSEPAVYLHGHGGLIKGLESAMTGRAAGEKFSVTLEPEQAYGPRHEDAQQRISVNHVISPRKGAVFACSALPRRLMETPALSVKFFEGG